MFEYTFVKIPLRIFTGKPKEDHRQVVADYAKRGYRLVQIFAPATSGNGKARYFELIFERPK